jgi:CheY-like chemotaxis protein
LKASDRAKNLVKQILAFSRQSNPQKRITSLRPIIEEVMDLLQSSIPSSVIIESDINTNLKPVMADPTQLHQALLNLATNAVHAMNRKGTLTFRLFAATLSRIENGRAGDMAAGEYAVIEVKDSGCGMDAATLSKAFEPFFTTKKVGEGTGMGLSVVLGIVQEHGGDIQVESEVGKGTIITIYLPTIDAREASTADEKLFPVSGTERILFVDDEQMLVDMNNDWLTSLGYTVTAVTNSQEALLVLKEKSAGFDLLVTDQTMPGITGIELAKEALQLWKDLPIILCTGFSNEVNRESAEAHGISKFIMKPYRSHEISYAIREVLDGKKK